DVVGTNDAGRAFDNRIQDGLDVSGGLADDPQDVVGSGLLLEGLRLFPRLLLQLIKEADVFESDHRLIGEGLEQLDLSISKWARLCTSRDEPPDDLILLQKPNAEERTRDGVCAQGGEIILLAYVGDMQNAVVGDPG